MSLRAYHSACIKYHFIRVCPFKLSIQYGVSCYTFTTDCGEVRPHVRGSKPGFGSEISCFFSIVYLTFWVAGRRVYKIQPNGDQH